MPMPQLASHIKGSVNSMGNNAKKGTLTIAWFTSYLDLNPKPFRFRVQGLGLGFRDRELGSIVMATCIIMVFCAFRNLFLS